MSVIESQFELGNIGKTDCDFCNDEPENGVLVEKPHSMVVHGQLIVTKRPQPLHICMGCLELEINNL